MSACAMAIGHHARVPVQLIAEVKKPRPLQILTHLLSLCNPQKPEVWIDQKLIGSKLGVHRDTVGRCVRYLEDIGQLIFLGYRPDGRRKRYLIKLPTEQTTTSKAEIAMKPPKATSGIFAGRPPAIRADDLRRNYLTINKEEETNIKKQTNAHVVVKKEYSSNEKIALKQKLKDLGVHKKIIAELVSKYSSEKINSQIEHLQLVRAQGQCIKKPAPWLIAAVKGNFELPRELDRATLEEEQQIKKQEKAVQLAQTAQREINIGNIKEAKRLAEESLAIAENNAAKAILDNENQKLERQLKIEEARKRISSEELELIRQEEEKKNLAQMRKLVTWNDVKILGSSFFKKTVEELVNDRLCAC